MIEIERQREQYGFVRSAEFKALAENKDWARIYRDAEEDGECPLCTLYLKDGEARGHIEGHMENEGVDPSHHFSTLTEVFTSDDDAFYQRPPSMQQIAFGVGQQEIDQHNQRRVFPSPGQSVWHAPSGEYGTVTDNHGDGTATFQSRSGESRQHPVREFSPAIQYSGNSGSSTVQLPRPKNTTRRETGPCPCECNSGGFCGGCGHAGCGGRRQSSSAVEDDQTGDHDCRSEEGVIIGLVDGIIADARIVAQFLREGHTTPGVQESLSDIRADEDVALVLNLTQPGRSQ